METTSTTVTTPAKIVRKHRVGTFTAGILLILFGVLFLLHLFVPAVSYVMIFHFWPCVLILIGFEMLYASRKEEEIIYDAGAIFLIILLAVFAMGMAGADLLIQYAIQEGAMVLH